MVGLTGGVGFRPGIGFIGFRRLGPEASGFRGSGFKV